MLFPARPIGAGREGHARGGIAGQGKGDFVMPVYEYACQTCGSRMEVRHGVNEVAPTECPECGGTLERVFTAPGGSTRRLWSPWGTSKRTAPAKVK